MHGRRPAPGKVRGYARHLARWFGGSTQIMPMTEAALRQRCRVGADPYAAHDNIIAAAACLGELRDGYGVAGFLAVYNARPARWEDHLAFGRPLLMETHAYLCARRSSCQLQCTR